MNFIISDTDKYDVEKEISSFKKTLYYGPFFVVILTTILLYRISLDNASTLVLCVMGFVFLIPPLALVLFAPRRAIRKYQKIIKEVQVLDGEICLIHIDNTTSFIKNCKLTTSEFIYGNKPYKATLIESEVNVPSSVLLYKFFSEHEQIIKYLETKKHCV